jgi:hypothetical protein
VVRRVRDRRARPARRRRVVAGADGGDASIGATDGDLDAVGTNDASTKDGDAEPACPDGGCPPVMLVRGEVDPVGIAVSGSYLFWAIDSTGAQAVRRCTLPACTNPITFADTQPRTVIVMADATNVFWARDTGVKRCPILGCVALPLDVASGTDTNGLFVRAGRVFWTDFLSSGPVGSADTLGTNVLRRHW